jgi:putative ABC transport system permease protein
VTAIQGRTATRTGRLRVRKATIAGFAVLITSGLLILFSFLHVYVGFAGAFAFLIGMSLLTGLVLVLAGPLLKRLFSTIAGLSGKIAAGNISQNLSRTTVAVAAFMVALSMSVGLGVMIGSFRESLVWWMDTQLQADMYIGSTSEGFEVSQRFYEEVKGIPGLGGVDPYRNVQVNYGGKSITIAAVSAEVLQKYTRFGWLRGGNENWEPVKRGDVIVSESFARNFKKGEGSIITLQGVDGPAEVRIAAVFYDYTTERGLVMMDRSTYLRIFDDHRLNSVGVFIDPGDPRRDELLEQAGKKADQYGLPVFFRQQLHRQILSVFDSTFAVTRSMRYLAIIVAFFGIAGALLTLFLERRREFGIYRALGFSTRQVVGMTLMEGLGMGIISFLLSTVVGTVLAVVLIKVINVQSFNWTIFFYPLWTPYLLAAVTALAASAGAALYPIWKVLRTYPHMQLREE